MARDRRSQVFDFFHQQRRVIVSLGLGACLGGAAHLATDMGLLLAEENPRVFVGSDCSASTIAVEHLEDSTVAIVPTDAGDLARSACLHTRALLAERGAFWLEFVSENWICDRFSRWGRAQLLAQGDVEGLPVIAFPNAGEWDYSLGVSDEKLSRLLGREIQGAVE